MKLSRNEDGFALPNVGVEELFGAIGAYRCSWKTPKVRRFSPMQWREILFIGVSYHDKWFKFTFLHLIWQKVANGLVDKAVNCGAVRPGFKSRWGREVFRFVRRVSVCEKSFGLREVFGIGRSVSDLWELVDWVIGMFEFRWYSRLYTHAFCHSFFWRYEKQSLFSKNVMCKSESADLFHLKIQLVL